MAGKEDVELVRRGYDAFIAGDMQWLNEHLHENIAWHVPGTSPLAGDYRGREEVLAYFGRLVQTAVPEFDIHDIAAGDDHVVALLNTRWRRPDGETWEGKGVQVFHVSGGQAVESWFMGEDEAGFDAFIAGGAAT